MIIERLQKHLGYRITCNVWTMYSQQSRKAINMCKIFAKAIVYSSYALVQFFPVPPSDDVIDCEIGNLQVQWYRSMPCSFLLLHLHVPSILGIFTLEQYNV
jgi:hypothetical protein